MASIVENSSVFAWSEFIPLLTFLAIWMDRFEKLLCVFLIFEGSGHQSETSVTAPVNPPPQLSATSNGARRVK